MSKNDKYVVFKREEWDEAFKTTDDTWLPPDEVDDAVVIRRQDMFAPQALHVYAHSIALVCRLLSRVPGQTQLKSDLQRTADYFHEQAEMAQDEAYKYPD